MYLFTIWDHPALIRKTCYTSTFKWTRTHFSHIHIRGRNTLEKLTFCFPAVIWLFSMYKHKLNATKNKYKGTYCMCLSVGWVHNYNNLYAMVALLTLTHSISESTVYTVHNIILYSILDTMLNQTYAANQSYVWPRHQFNNINAQYFAPTDLCNIHLLRNVHFMKQSVIYNVIAMYNYLKLSAIKY